MGGIVVFFVLARGNYLQLSKANRYVYILLIIVLAAVLFLARDVRGSARWIDLGFFRLQPVEFVKISVVLGLARFFSLRRGLINSFKNILTTLVFVGLPAVLVLLQPDLGSSLILSAIWFGMLLVSQIKIKYTLCVVAFLLLGVAAIWTVGLKDYQRQRVETFLNRHDDLSGSGYNVNQALIAVGNGKIFGEGLGRGVQGNLKFLPEQQTDFIFAATAEEVGLVGCLVLLLLYLVMLIRLIKIASLAKDSTGAYITAGVFFMFFSHMVINIGMNTGMLPVTGITLPFLSYGGSSLVANLAALGIVQNIASQS